MSRESNDAFDAWAKKDGFRQGTWNYIRTAAAWHAAIAYAERLGALGGAPPDGWKLVPVEPTPEMCDAAAATPGIKNLDNMAVLTQLRYGSDWGAGSGRALDWGDGSPLEQAWRAMLAAAPNPLVAPLLVLPESKQPDSKAYFTSPVPSEINKTALPRWIPVSERLPECGGGRIFIGINSAGFAGAFNRWGLLMGHYVTCYYETAEESIEVMSELARWMPLPPEVEPVVGPSTPVRPTDKRTPASGYHDPDRVAAWKAAGEGL